MEIERLVPIIRSVGSRRRAFGTALGLAAIARTAGNGAARKRGKKKHKRKNPCPASLQLVAGRCAKPCETSADCGGAGLCRGIYTQGEIGPRVCALVADYTDCDTLAERFCNAPSECGSDQQCVVDGVICPFAYCAATRFP